jgi:hemoglobin-like flavoprotein
MTPEQLASVRRTALELDRHGDDFARRFYTALFERHPTARRLFPPDMRAQRDKLVDELLALVACADDLATFLARARRIGARHQRVGVHAADYPFIGDALVAAVAGVATDGWTAQADAAWRRMWALIAEGMLEGAEDGLFNEPG